MKHLEVKIKGMHCASCALNITHSLNKNEYIRNADTNFATKKAMLDYDENNIEINTIKQIIHNSGYDIEDDNSENMERNDENKKVRNKTLMAIILSLPLLLRMIWMWNIPGEFSGISNTDWLQFLLATIVVFFLGLQFHRNAYKALMRRQTDMDTLISLGTLSAYFFSIYAMIKGQHLYFESAATITALILLGRYMETKTKNRASRAMEKLLEISAKEATVIGVNKEKQKKPINEINIGEIIQVKTGEKIPLDGIIKSGSASINESMLTGEPLPCNKKEGDYVFAGTMNKNGMIEIKVTKDGNSTMLSSIIKTVEDAQKYKAPTQQLADKISSIFVPTVVFLSIITFTGWFLITGNAGDALLKAVAILVISCPCALGIATPIAIMVGSSVGAKRGILIKNGESFEKAKNIDVLLFDKTGTLTEGKPKVKNIIVNTNVQNDEKQILMIAASLSSNSTHPLSEAISEYAQKKNTQTLNTTNYQELPGEGILAQYEKNNIQVGLGNKELIKRAGADTGWADKQKLNGNGTLNYVIKDKTVIGAILIADTLRESSENAINKTKMIGVEPRIVSGDTEDNVKNMATALGIKKYYSSVLPNQKREKVKKLQMNNKKVAFAGDGINDAPALAQADLGIAMASGTDIAKEAGDLVILSNDPAKIPEAIKLSQMTFKIIKQNLFWAFFYNSVAIPLAMLGFVNPMLAAVAMAFSDLSVIGNSLRLYKNTK